MAGNALLAPSPSRDGAAFREAAFPGTRAPFFYSASTLAGWLPIAVS